MKKALGLGALLAALCASPALASSRVYLDNCAGKGAYKPATVTLSCGDGTTLLSHLRWSNWGSHKATATGTYSFVSCVPDCADGREVKRSARVTVDSLTGHRYLRITVREGGHVLYFDDANGPERL